MKHAARTHRPRVQRLTRFLTIYLMQISGSTQLRGEHIPGKDNMDADLLSRFSGAPSWASVYDQGSPVLRTCQAFQVRRDALSAIANLLSSEQTEAWYTQRNAGTFDSRARAFAAFLDTAGFDDVALRRIDPDAAHWLIAAFLRKVRSGEAGCSRRANLKANTLAGYVAAAECWCIVKLGVTPSTRLADGSIQKSVVSTILHDSKTWQQPLPRMRAVHSMTMKSLTWYCPFG